MEIGEVYGKYRLMERIATGGMAEVYKAMALGEAGFERPVAIKRLHRQYGDDEDLVGMLQDEARLCSQLHHGNICQVLDLGRVDDTYYIAMEYVNGKDLFNILRKAARTQNKLPLSGALFIACEMLAGLDYAHRKRDGAGQLLHIIHRDISPQNVLITYDGEVKIIDFGIAKARTSTHRTQAGVIKGKFRYMSPEQARGEPIDHRTDIFATGVVLYEMITGRPHAAGATDREILIKIQKGSFDRLGELVLGLPAELEELVHKALSLTPETRWSSARAMRKGLINFMRANGLVYTRDDLAEYVRELFVENTGKGTQIDPLENLGSEDLALATPSGGHDPFEPRPARPEADPFDPGMAPVETVGLTPKAKSNPAAPVTPPAKQTPPTPAQPAAPGFPTGPPAHRPPQPAPAQAQPAPAQKGPPAAAAPQLADDPHAQAATQVTRATQGRGRPSAFKVLLNFLVLVILLGLIGVGGYFAYKLHFEKPSVRKAAQKDDKHHRKRRHNVRQVKATLEIDSRPRGARILLSGQDVQVKTPGKFPDYQVPSRLLVELRHKRFKTPWKKVIEIGNGDVVRFTADLRNPPQTKSDKTRRRVRPPVFYRRGMSRRAAMTPAMDTHPPDGLAKTDVAHLAVTADVKGAQVLINGRVRGKTPFFRKVRPSTFRIQVRHGTRKSEVRTVTLRPGRDAVVKFTLGL